MKKSIALILFLITAGYYANATHQRAGEITYKWLYGLTYEVTIVTYTFTPSQADRPELELFWGDGTSDIVQRIEKVNLPNNISRNTYTYNGSGTGGRHTYPAPGTYTMWMEDPNRNAGIYNIPNSVNIPFYLETQLVINPFLGHNNSPVLQNPPLDNACVFQPFMHNPWAYDADGDSLSYRLDSCKGQGGLYIPGYIYPPASNSFSIDALTGDLLWDSPMVNGEYNICIIIDEWRSGIRIGSVRRDMQITVIACNNHPPVIGNLKDTCVLAGTLLQFTVSATDPDGDDITLIGNGGPLSITDNPANFNQPVTGTGSVSSVFTWQTRCSHVKLNPYQVNFKVTDDSYPVNLVDFASVRITVVGPAPENLTATAGGNQIVLNWNKSKCANAVGYKVYRRSGYYGFFPDDCETGVPSYTGYSEIAALAGINDTVYTDNNNGSGLIHGIDYCYMVIAYYPDGAESYASLEACATLKKDVPVITNVSISTTDDAAGSIYIAWSAPTELDPVQTPGPYKYLIYRAENITGTNFVLTDSLANLNDTVYNENLLDTRSKAWHYRIDLYNDSPGNRFLIGTTHEASSIFLSLIPSDNKLTLNWNLLVPWINDYYVIYRYNPVSLVFDSIGVSTLTTFTDEGLVNGNSYCYKVKGVGRYSAPGYAFPLINYSQEKCGIPVDNEAPCPPQLTVVPDCDYIVNRLSWTFNDPVCSSDAIQCNLYYAPSEAGDYTLIQSLPYPADTVYVHSGLFTIAGCYYITAVDSFQNESLPGIKICVDIDACDLYSLPNIFTPNGDGSNDLFIPFPYDFVEGVEMKIFNRWGKVVFTTNDPDINWDGRNQSNSQPCSDGVYYYVCNVFERRLEGTVKRTITGFVHLLR